MQNPVIVLAIIAIIFGIFNILLWYFLIKSDKKAPAAAGKASDIQNLIFASEKRMIDTLTKMLASLKGAGGGGAVDTKKLTAELKEALKGQKQAVELPGLDEVKKALSEVPSRIEPLSASLKQISGELENQRNFIEALDAHLVNLENKKS